MLQKELFPIFLMTNRIYYYINRLTITTTLRLLNTARVII